MFAKQLVSNDEIYLAKKLLHQIYCKVIKWDIEEGNPSNLKICKSPQGDYLDDIYSNLAIWFGAFENSELISSIRVIKPIKNALELQLYNDTILDSIINKYKNIFEINRLAIKSEFLNSPVSAYLIREVAKWGIESNVDCFVTTYNSIELKNLTMRLGFKQTSSTGFKYSENDSAESFVVHFAIDDINSLKNIINICDQVIGKDNNK